MAKTESTAVNELISLVQGTQSPPTSMGAGDSGDLFGSMHPPRMTSTMPPTAGEIAPLPRSRAPQATSQHATGEPVRMRTASPPRGTTIPPLSRRSAPAGTLPPPPPGASRASAPKVSPTAIGSAKTSRPSGTMAPPMTTRAPASRPSAPAARTSAPPAQASEPAPVKRMPPPPPRPSAAHTMQSPKITAAQLEASVPAPRYSASTTVPAMRASDDIEIETEMPVAAAAPAPRTSRPSLAHGTFPPPMMRRSDLEDDASPFAAAPLPPSLAAQFPVITPPDVAADHWYESRASTDKLRHSETRALIKKLIAPALLVIAAGVVAGAVIVTGRKHEAPAKPTTPPPTVVKNAPDEELVVRPALPRAESDNAGTASAGGAQPEPPTKAEQAAQIAAAMQGDQAAAGEGTMTHEAPAEVVDALANRAVADGTVSIRQVKTARGVLALADVRIDSDPAGATVTLVDNGKQSFLGTTPLSTSVDASREYDVIIELDGRPAQMAHLDPTKTSRLDVSLGRKHAAPAPTSAAAVPSRPRAARAVAEVKKAVAEANLETASDSTPLEAPVAAAAKTGILMVSSKPPCDLLIDGDTTGLTTPQRSLELSPGSHEITFVNEEAGIKKTVTVKITAGESTKLIQNLMQPE